IFYAILHVLLQAVHLKGRQKFPVWEMRNTVTISTDAHKSLDITVPRCQIFISNRPINGYAFLCVGLKIQITPALGPPTPQERSPARLVSPYPIEGLFLLVRMLLVLDYKMVIGFIETPG